MEWSVVLKICDNMGSYEFINISCSLAISSMRLSVVLERYGYLVLVSYTDYGLVEESLEHLIEGVILL